MLLLFSKHDLNTIVSIKELLDTVLENNVFHFNKKLYRQEKGVPMGGAISGLLAEVYLKDVEEKWVIKNKKVIDDKILMITRYVDDILIIWKGASENLEELMKDYEDISNLKLKLEEQSENTINYLDMTIRKDANFGFATTVHRKPTYKTSIIPWTSVCPNSYKLSALNSLIVRALRYCSKNNDLMEELCFIKKCVADFGFNRNVFERQLRHNIGQEERKKVSLNNNSKEMKYRSLTYTKGVSERIARKFSKLGIKIAHKVTNSVEKSLSNVKPRLSKSMNAGVYTVPLLKGNGEEKVYIGSTSRNILIRLREHRKDIIEGESRTGLARSVLEEGFIPKWSFTEVSTVIGQTCKLRSKEELLIHLNRDRLVNDHIPYAFGMDSWIDLFKKERTNINRKEDFLIKHIMSNNKDLSNCIFCYTEIDDLYEEVQDITISPNNSLLELIADI